MNNNKVLRYFNSINIQMKADSLITLQKQFSGLTKVVKSKTI